MQIKNINQIREEIDMKFFENLEISEEKIEKLENFKNLLLRENEKYNLTSILDEEEIEIKHFYDSIFGEKYIEKNKKGIDVGSGGGFPAIPIGITREDLRYDLLEATEKKCRFIEMVKEELKISNINVINMRAEDAGKDLKYREKYDFCTARAVARLSSLSEYCLPFVKVGGLFIAYKGIDEDEINEGKGAIGRLGGIIKEIIDYELPLGMGKRKLVIVEKIKNTDKKYPRENARIRNKPL